MEKDVRQPDSTDLHAAELGKRHDVDAGQDVSAVPPPGATLGQGMEAPPGAPGILIEDLLIGLPANIGQPGSKTDTSVVLPTLPSVPSWM